ncbi:MAG: cell wall hydrolase [Bacillota bacterium]
MKPVLVLIILLTAMASSLFFLEVSQADWTYTVQRGDTLFTIAKKTGLTVDDIRNRNGLGWSLRIGQKIIIPTATSRVAAPTPSSGNVNLLAHLIQGEAGSEPYIGKVAVGGVVMNRIQDPKFPKTIAGIIYQPGAFESVSNGIINQEASAECQKAAQDAISGWDPSGGAIYFFNPSKTSSPWMWARRIINRIGNHVFAI